MKLTVQKRDHSKKSVTNKLRRNGMIPAIIYHKEKEGETVAVPTLEFTAHLRHIESGHLPTTVFSLTDSKGKERKVILKDVQYDPVSYDVIHLDFEELHDNVPVKVKIPIVVTGEMDCVGVKLGGVIRLAIRHLKVECLPKDMPKSFEINVKEMNLGQVRRLSDLSIPNTVRPLMPLKEVAVTMVKK